MTTNETRMQHENPERKMSKQWVSIKELMEILPYSKRTLAEKVTRRKDFPAPYRPTGWQRFWDREEVTKWIESKRCSA